MKFLLAFLFNLLKNEIVNRLTGLRRDVLPKIANLYTLQKPSLTAIKVFVADNNIHQRGFPAAVLAHKANFIPLMDMKGHILKDSFFPESNTAFLNAKDKS